MCLVPLMMSLAALADVVVSIAIPSSRSRPGIAFVPALHIQANPFDDGESRFDHVGAGQRHPQLLCNIGIGAQVRFPLSDIGPWDALDTCVTNETFSPFGNLQRRNRELGID